MSEALVVADAEAMFGPRQGVIEYRDGELWTPALAAERAALPAAPGDQPGEQPGA